MCERCVNTVCYGTVFQNRGDSSLDVPASHGTKKSATSESAKRIADKGTAEENISLAAAADDHEHEEELDDVEEAAAHRSSVLDSRGSGPARDKKHAALELD